MRIDEIHRLTPIPSPSPKNDSGRLGAGNAGVYYNGTIYASASQAAGVMAWDRIYGTMGFTTGGFWPSYKKE